MNYRRYYNNCAAYVVFNTMSLVSHLISTHILTPTPARGQPVQSTMLQRPVAECELHLTVFITLLKMKWNQANIAITNNGVPTKTFDIFFHVASRRYFSTTQRDASQFACSALIRARNLSQVFEMLLLLEAFSEPEYICWESVVSTNQCRQIPQLLRTKLSPVHLSNNNPLSFISSSKLIRKFLLG